MNFKTLLHHLCRLSAQVRIQLWMHMMIATRYTNCFYDFCEIRANALQVCGQLQVSDFSKIMNGFANFVCSSFSKSYMKAFIWYMFCIHRNVWPKFRTNQEISNLNCFASQFNSFLFEVKKRAGGYHHYFDQKHAHFTVKTYLCLRQFKKASVQKIYSWQLFKFMR